MIYRLFVLTFIIWFPSLLQAQINDQFGWKVEASDTLTKNEAEVIKRLKFGGFKLDMESISNGEVKLLIDGVKFFAPLLKSK